MLHLLLLPMQPQAHQRTKTQPQQERDRENAMPQTAKETLEAEKRRDISIHLHPNIPCLPICTTWHLSTLKFP